MYLSLSLIYICVKVITDVLEESVVYGLGPSLFMSYY